MKIKLRYTAFIPLSLALGCSGGTGASVGTLQPADTTISANSGEAVKLGEGWDKTAEVFKSQCVSSKTVHGGQSYGHILSSNTIAQSTVEQQLGIDVNVKGHYLIANGQDKLELSNAIKEDDYSESFIFEADYQTGIDSLDETTLKNTPIGDGAGVNWQTVCGDEVVYQTKTGASLYFIQRIDFISREEKSKFDNDLQLSINGGVYSGDLEAKIQTVANKYAKSAHVHIEVFQFGGDPTALGAVLNGTGGAMNGSQAVADCDITNLAACKTVYANAVKYTDPAAPNGLAAQLKNSAISPSPVSYLTKPWQNFNRNTVPHILTQEILTARNELETKFDALMKWKVRIDRLLYTIGSSGIHSFALPPEQLTELENWKTKLTSDLGLVNQAVTACYDAINFDTQGNPLPNLVTACQKAVDAVPNESPPVDLMTAAGRYEIDFKWTNLGGTSSPLGDYQSFVRCFGVPPHRLCVTLRDAPVAVGPDSVGLMQQFVNGQMYWSPDTDAHAVYGLILQEYLAVGGPGPSGLALGFPLNDESPAQNGGRYNDFQNGSIYWKSSTGAHEVHGGIRDRWTSLGRETSMLGYPTSDETSTPDNYGRFNTFEGGSIYWTPATGAWEVLGLIRNFWGNAGWEKSVYAYPTTGEIWEQNGDWRHSDFQHGSIYFNATLFNQGKPAVFGFYNDLASKFWQMRSNPDTFNLIGYPMGSEAPTPVRSDGVTGLFVPTQHGGIWWDSKSLAAHEIHGAIYGLWAQNGWEQGKLGYPTTDELALTDSAVNASGAYSFFEKGAILWTGNTGAHVLQLFLGEWNKYGSVNGTSTGNVCGFPVDEETWHTVTFGRNYWRQNFQNGYMKYTTSDNTFESHCPSDGN